MRDYSDIQKKEMKDRLKKIATRKLKTTMIFPLSEFERNFGHLWGHGRPDNELTDEQREYRRIWNQCREDILDNGNKQLRGLLSEINMHEIIWKRYITKIVFK